MKPRHLYMVTGLLLVLALLTLVYFFYSPYTYPFPGCMLYVRTGFYCPACGSQRAFSDLLHGQFMGAFRNNLLFVTGAPVLVFYYLRFLLFGWKKNDPFPVPAPGICLVVLLMIMVFWILRNLPAFSCLAPVSH